MSRGERVRRFFGLNARSTAIGVASVPGNGDCFYNAVVTALRSSDDDRFCELSVSVLRELVASNLTHEIVEVYSALALARVRGYDFMRHIEAALLSSDVVAADEPLEPLEFRRLAALRHAVRQCGNHVGTGRCIWADEHAIQTVADHFHTTFLILNEERTITLSVVGPRPTSVDAATTLTRSATMSESESASADGCDSASMMYMVLHLTRRSHYDALWFLDRAGQRHFVARSANDLPPAVASRFGILQDASLVTAAPVPTPRVPSAIPRRKTKSSEASQAPPAAKRRRLNTTDTKQDDDANDAISHSGGQRQLSIRSFVVQDIPSRDDQAPSTSRNYSNCSGSGSASGSIDETPQQD